MLTHQFEISKERYEKFNIREKFLIDMASYRAEAGFYSATKEIIWQRNKDRDEWDKGDEISYDHFRRNLESAITAEYALYKVYKSLFGELSDEENKLTNEMVKELVDHALEVKGWKEQKKKEENK